MKHRKLTSDGRIGIFRRIFKHESSVLISIFVVIVAALGGLTGGLTLTKESINSVWLQSATRGIASVGQLFVMLSAGIDLSVAGIANLSTMLGTLLLTTGHKNIIGHPLSLGAGVVLALLFAIGLGAINGVLVSRVRVPALIVTLGMWTITGGASYLISEGYTIYDLPSSYAFFGQGQIAGMYAPVILFVVVAVIGYLVLSYTPFGRQVYAVGGNSVSAWLSGINVNRTRFMTYVISGFMAGLAGLVSSSRAMAASMTTASGLELDSITAICLGGVSLAGGRGTMIGAVIGTMMLGVINNGMNVMALEPALRNILKGTILVVAVAIDVLRRR